MVFERTYVSVAGILGANTPATIPNSAGVDRMFSAFYVDTAAGTSAERTIVTGVPGAGDIRVIAGATAEAEAQFEAGDAMAQHSFLVMQVSNFRVHRKWPWP